MSLSVGIVGLPNVGKSTLFNALASRRLSPTAVHPFTTIEPHEAVVPVPDENLEKLAILVSRSAGPAPGFPPASARPSPARVSGALPPVSPASHLEIVPATVTFIDIAGLVKGAHEGAGLGNKFLAKIREVDAIVHVVREFTDPNIPHVHPSAALGTSEQIKEDIEVVNLELELGGITGKPVIYVMNIDEKHLEGVDTSPPSRWEGMVGDAPVIEICAKLEEDLSDLQPEERKQYLKELDLEESGLEKLIKETYKILNLITFYTIKGGKEIHAWSLKKGSTALSAAERVHTDFAKNFIKAEVISVDRLLVVSSWKEAKEKGEIKLEGKDYIVKDGDVIEFKIGV